LIEKGNFETCCQNVDLWFVESWDSKRNMEMVMTDQKVMYHSIVYMHYIFCILEKKYLTLYA